MIAFKIYLIEWFKRILMFFLALFDLVLTFTTLTIYAIWNPKSLSMRLARTMKSNYTIEKEIFDKKLLKSQAKWIK